MVEMRECCHVGLQEVTCRYTMLHRYGAQSCTETADICWWSLISHVKLIRGSRSANAGWSLTMFLSCIGGEYSSTGTWLTPALSPCIDQSRIVETQHPSKGTLLKSTLDGGHPINSNPILCVSLSLSLSMAIGFDVFLSKYLKLNQNTFLLRHWAY